MVGGCFTGKGFRFGNVDSGTCILVYTPIVDMMIYLNIFLMNFPVGGGGGLSPDCPYSPLICACNICVQAFFFFF